MILSKVSDLYFTQIPGSRCRVRSGGRGRIFGSVKIAGVPDQPVQRLVFLVQSNEIGLYPYGLHNADFPIPVAKVVSDPVTGTFEVGDVQLGSRYHAIAYDHTGQYDPVVKMNLVPTAY